MMSLWDALRMNMMISYQELVRTFPNSTRWRMEQEGKFPKRIKIGPSAVAYRLSEVQAWIKGKW
ncbi:hypothetical protein DN595_12325 [Enterobacter cloacae]|uniref:AlpA family phage regulatory protein n=1 Tax=Enterobacter cloacae TaxID=550 RepID=A0AB37VJ27_ENTCL|nr:hypothetical protein DN595_12325 [Enterobacter cloacae]